MAAGAAGAGGDLRSRRRFVNIAAAITATGGLLFGYDTGVISGALLFIKKDFAPLSPFVQGVIVSFLLVGAVIGALSGGPLSDRVGRRPTALLAAIIFGLGALTVALSPGVAVIIVGRFLLGLGVVLATVCLALYIASFAISLGPVFWLMISESYPLRIRGTAMSVASIANWGSNFLVALTFPVLLAALGGAGAFWLFAVLGIVAWFFVYFRVPETKNRTLEEIEASFRGTTVGSSRV